MNISILMPNLNQGKYLLSAAGTALEYQFSELILLDPGSLDNSREILSALLNLYPDRVKLELSQDEGPADALNKGIRMASGEIVGVLNSDDLYLPGALEYVGRFFTDNPDIDILLGSGILYYEDEQRMKLIFAASADIKDLILGVSGFFHQGMFIRKSSFPGATFNSENKINWDYEFLIDLHLFNPKIAVSRVPVALFRIRKDSISQNIPKDVGLLERQRINSKNTTSNAHPKSRKMRFYIKRCLNFIFNVSRIVIFQLRRH
jgi:glycosyltransferase involved in cell wall biosynthesis